MNIRTLGGTKFILCVGSAAVTSLLQAFGKLDAAGSTYAMAVIGTVGAYIAGNVTQTIKGPPETAK